MPRYARSFVDVALDREIDRLWEFHDRLEKKLDAALTTIRTLQATVAGEYGDVPGASGGSTGPGNGSGNPTPTPTPEETSPTDTITSVKASQAQGWAGGGRVVANDVVVHYGDLTLTGDLVVEGTMVVTSIPSGSTIVVPAMSPMFGVVTAMGDLPVPVPE